MKVKTITYVIFCDNCMKIQDDPEGWVEWEVVTGPSGDKVAKHNCPDCQQLAVAESE